MSKTVVLASLGVLALAMGSRAAPQTSWLTPHDEAEIRQLSARYAHALGLCHADEYAKAFTNDASTAAPSSWARCIARCTAPGAVRSPVSDMTRFVTSEPQCSNATAPKTPREAPAHIPISATPGGGDHTAG